MDEKRKGGKAGDRQRGRQGGSDEVMETKREGGR